MLARPVVHSYPRALYPSGFECSLDVVLLVRPPERLRPDLLAELCQRLATWPSHQAVVRGTAIRTDPLVSQKPCGVWRDPLHDRSLRRDGTTNAVFKSNFKASSFAHNILNSLFSCTVGLRINRRGTLK